MPTIIEEVHDLPTSNGPMRTYLLRPAGDGAYPGILLYSEIYQVTGPIRRIAAFLAGCGYVVAVPEIYHELEAAGTILQYDGPGTERGNSDKISKELASYDADSLAVLAFLSSYAQCTGKLGVIGFCIGGHLAARAALSPEVAAAACFYATDIHSQTLGLGKNDDTLARLSEIRGELLMIWGRQDPHAPKEGRQLIYETLTAGDVNFQWHEFNDAHAFMRDEGPRYDPALARLCYELVLDLFQRILC